jgi:prevent-host-death family protein
MLRRVTASEAREEFAEVINKVAYGGERVVIRRRDKELAAVVPMEDLRLLERLIREEEDRIDAEEARKILDDPVYAEGSVPLYEVKKDLGLE